ncbi:MAG: toxin-antitoxin system YwqK family antitoxin [Bacteroidota bacterium]
MSQNLVYVKDKVMDNYMQNGYASKNFVPNGKTDSNNLRQGFWKDYEVITDVAFVIKNNKPEKVLGRFLIYGEGKYMDGKRIGKWDFFVIEDQTFKKILNQQLNFNNGVLEGSFKYFYSNKKIACEGNHRDNKLDGTVKTFYDNGKPYEIKLYKNNLKDGIQKTFYPDGKIKVENNFIEGKTNGLCQYFYSNGKTEEKFYYNMGKEDGLYQYYHENGQLWIEKTYSNGALMNIIVNYDSDGKPRDFGTLKDGQGTGKYYDKNGKIYTIITYKDGFKVSEENF